MRRIFLLLVRSGGKEIAQEGWIELKPLSYFTYKPRRVSHGDISPQQTDETRAYRSKGPSPGRGYGPAATIQPATRKPSTNSFYSIFRCLLP